MLLQFFLLWMDQKHRTCSGLNIKSIGFGKEWKGLERFGKDKQRFCSIFLLICFVNTHDL